MSTSTSSKVRDYTADEKVAKASKLLESAVINTLGQEAWDELQEIEIEHKEDGLLEGNLYLRQRMRAAGLLDVDGFREKFPLIAQFDEITCNHRGNGQSSFISSVNVYFCKAKAGSIPNGGYEDDGFRYERQLLDAHRLDYLPYKKKREVSRCGESIHTLAGNYVAKGTGTKCEYYYQNELDHLFTYLLDCCLSPNRNPNSIKDLGLAAMKEAVADEQKEQFPKENWESGISSDTKYKMGFLEAVCGGMLGDKEDADLRAGFDDGIASRL